MADYYSPTVIQQMIPITGMTSLERLCLTNIFESEEHDEKLYFFASESPVSVIWLDHDELVSALAAPENAAYATMEEFREPLGRWRPSDSSVMVDLSVLSWENFFQNILKRTTTLKYISATTSYYCSKMRVDGFGGMVVLITADAIMGKSTDEVLAEMLDDAGIPIE